MSSSPEVPKVPDPNITAANQANYNTAAGQKSQEGSMVNQNNEFGSLNYQQTGTSPDGTPLYTANTTFSPQQKQLLDILQGTKTTAGQQGSALLSGANYGTANPGDVIGDNTKGLTQDAMAKQIKYLDPYFTADVDKLDTKLRNQGFAPGEPGYDRAMMGLKNSQGNTVTGFEASMEPQMWQQATANYLLPAQLSSALAALGSPTSPNSSFVQTPGLNVKPPDLEGDVSSANQANMAAYGAQLGQNNAMMSGLFGIPTAALGGLAKNGSLTGLSGLFGAGAGAGADTSAAALAGLEALGPAAII